MGARAVPHPHVSWTVKHFHDHLRDRRFALSHTWTKTVLQRAGLVNGHRAAARIGVAAAQALPA